MSTSIISQADVQRASQLAREALAAEDAAREEYEAKTVAAFGPNGQKFTIAQLRQAFDVVENAEHWKNEFRKAILPSMVDVTYQAIIFYHGVRPTVVYATDGSVAWIASTGYAG